MRAIPLFTLLLCLFFDLFHARAQEIIEREIQSQQKRLETLQHEIQSHRERAKEVERGKRTVLQELQELNDRITRQWQRLRDTKKEWTRKELALVATRQELKKKEKALEELKKLVEARLKALSEMGTIGTLNVLFAAESIPELLSRETYLRFLLKRDEVQRKEYLEKLGALKRMQEQLLRDQEVLKKASLEMEKEALLLEEKRQERRAFLEELKQQSVRYYEMISELENASASLKSIINKLESRVTDTRKNQVTRTEIQAVSLPSQKGRLSPPVFGKIRRPSLGGRTAPGILLEAPWGSEISAVFDGTVAYSGKLKGYGNVIILDHGDGYLSLVAQACELFKKVGEEVREGELIGLVGGGPWVDEGVYFEIRHNGRYEDPLSWLDTRGLKIESK